MQLSNKTAEKHNTYLCSVRFHWKEGIEQMGECTHGASLLDRLVILYKYQSSFLGSCLCLHHSDNDLLLFNEESTHNPAEITDRHHQTAH